MLALTQVVVVVVPPQLAPQYPHQVRKMVVLVVLVFPRQSQARQHHSQVAAVVQAKLAVAAPRTVAVQEEIIVQDHPQPLIPVAGVAGVLIVAV